MSYQHQELAAGRWSQLSLVEQMANIGSEVERLLNWRARNHAWHTERAFGRTLELLDLTLADSKNRGRLKELARTREAIVDDVVGPNQFSSTDSIWRKYFSCFAYAARRHR